MDEGLNKLMCGNCGKLDFAVYAKGSGSDYKFVVECAHCKSTTVIESQKPTLKVGWGDKSKGVLCYKN